MGRLLANGFETTIYRDDGVQEKVVLPPKDCYRALWEPVDCAYGATVRVLLDILGSDVEFYGRLLGTRHLAAYLDEPANDNEAWQTVSHILYVEFKRYAERWLNDNGPPAGDFDFYPDISGIGKSEDPSMGDAGEDVGYTLSFTPLPSMANLPVVVCDDVDMCTYGGESEISRSTLGRMPLRLVDMLMALVEEASFHGSPASRQESIRRLKDSVEQVEADIASGEIDYYPSFDEVDGLTWDEPKDSLKSRFLLDNGDDEAAV